MASAVAANTHKAVTKRMLAITYRDMYKTRKRHRSQSRPEKRSVREKAGGGNVRQRARGRRALAEVVQQHCSPPAYFVEHKDLSTFGRC